MTQPECRTLDECETLEELCAWLDAAERIDVAAEAVTRWLAEEPHPLEKHGEDEA